MNVVNGIKKRVIHIIRHAESEFNILANHQMEGFVPAVTKLDANLTDKGIAQAQSLGEKISTQVINGYPPTHPLSPKNAEIVITSPLSRAIQTASYSLPFDRYKYIVRPEISEQIENTTDIPVSKRQLSLKFPALKEQIASLPECWWYRHPQYRNVIISNPQYDADLLYEYNGEEPASESKDMLRRRIKWFFKWLFDGPQQRYTNIVVYSHCCTIFEMERVLKGISEDIQHDDVLNAVSMPQNTEVRTFQLMENLMDIPKHYFDDQSDEHLCGNFEGFYTISSATKLAYC